MSETFQRLLALEAHVQVLTKRLEETASAIPAGVGPGMQVPDYANYKGPFMVGLQANGYVKVGAGYILAPGGAYAYGGGTSGGLTAGTNYVVLKIDMDDDEVDAVTVQIKAALSDITSTGTEKQVLIAVVKCEGGSAVGRVQEQRGNIYVEVGGGDSALVVMEASTLSPGAAAQVDMTIVYEPDATVLDAVEASPSHVDVKEAGYYHVDLYADIATAVPGGASVLGDVYAEVRVNGASVSGFKAELAAINVEPVSGYTGLIRWKGSVSGTMLLAADDVVSVWLYGAGTTEECGGVRLSMRKVRGG